MSDIEIRKAADEYWSATLTEKSDGLDSYHLGVLDAFAAGVKWARAQWPITPRTAEEAKPADFGQALGLMWADLGKKLDELSIWCGALEGQANRIQRETHGRLDLHNELIGNMLKMLARAGIESGVTLNDLDARLTHLQEVPAVLRDVGQKVEAVISLVDDLDELIRSEDDEAEPLTAEELGAFKEGVDEAYRPAVGMFGIGGDASVASIHRPEPTFVMKKRTMGNGLKFRVGDGEATVLGADPGEFSFTTGTVSGVDPASPDDDATVASVRDAEGRTHPLVPPRWAGAILDVFIHNNQLYVRCERAVFVHFGGQHLIPMQFGA